MFLFFKKKDQSARSTLKPALAPFGFKVNYFTKGLKYCFVSNNFMKGDWAGYILDRLSDARNEYSFSHQTKFRIVQKTRLISEHNRTSCISAQSQVIRTKYTFDCWIFTADNQVKTYDTRPTPFSLKKNTLVVNKPIPSRNNSKL